MNHSSCWTYQLQHEPFLMLNIPTTAWTIPQVEHTNYSMNHFSGWTCRYVIYYYSMNHSSCWTYQLQHEPFLMLNIPTTAWTIPHVEHTNYSMNHSSGWTYQLQHEPFLRFNMPVCNLLLQHEPFLRLNIPTTAWTIPQVEHTGM